MYGTTGSTLPGWLFSKGHLAVFILFEAPTSGADPGSAQCGIASAPSRVATGYILPQELEQLDHAPGTIARSFLL